MKKTLLQGNKALAESAIISGCRFYAGYPITPQNEIPEYLSTRMNKIGGIFIQAESELSAINMLYGASACGIRAMTTSSSPGISLMQEGISFLAAAELPSVIVNIQRGGPGLGNISASQGDYFQSVKGGGHGDYKLLVYSPYTVQEMWDLTAIAFDRAEKYRIPAMILADAIIGQMTEPIIMRKPPKSTPYQKEYSFQVKRKDKWFPIIIKTLRTAEGELSNFNLNLHTKYKEIQNNEVLYETLFINDAELIVVAFGISARIASSAITKLRSKGHKVGLLRPITLFPFPSNIIHQLACKGVRFITIELNMGQMFEDVKLAINGKSELSFYGKPSGSLFAPKELEEVLLKHLI